MLEPKRGDSWFQDNNRTIPAGPDLREHKHAVMQVANSVVHKSTTGFAVMHGMIHKKPKSTHTSSAGRLLSWLQVNSNTKNTGKVHHDRNDAGMQHNTTSSTAGCKLPPPDHSRHVHKPGSIQAWFASATLKEAAAKQQLASGNKASTRSLKVLRKPPASDTITVDKEIHLQQEKTASDCSISLDTTRKARKARQASTILETYRARMTTHTTKLGKRLYGILHDMCKPFCQFAFGAYGIMRQAVIQWGCARKLFAAATVSMQCTCVKSVKTNMVTFAVMLNNETRMTHICIT